MAVELDQMKEPYLSQFRRLVELGAGAKDIHDAASGSGYAVTTKGSHRFIDREVERVRLHRNRLCPLLEQFVGEASRILDVGCGTGGTTVALAMSPVLRPAEVVGADLEPLSLQAADVRARGFGLGPDRVKFMEIEPGERLPFSDGRFDLTVCVSVLEFISNRRARFRFAKELLRVTAEGGHVFLATPNAFSLREYHSRRLLGNFLRKSDYPWSSTPSELRRMFSGCTCVRLSAYRLRGVVERLGVTLPPVPILVAEVVTALLPWQNYLFQRPLRQI